MAFNDPPPELTPKQQRAIAALMTARTHEDAAKVAGIAERTLARWLKLPAFVAALREAEADLVGDAIRRMSGAMAKAVDVMIDSMDAKLPTGDAEHVTRLRGSALLTKRRMESTELEVLEARVAALEQGRKDEQGSTK